MGSLSTPFAPEDDFQLYDSDDTLWSDHDEMELMDITEICRRKPLSYSNALQHPNIKIASASRLPLFKTNFVSRNKLMDLHKACFLKEARLRNLTYSSPLYIEMTKKVSVAVERAMPLNEFDEE